MTTKKMFRIGTRDSLLAIWQAEWVQAQLTRLYPNYEVCLVPMKTKGDKILDVPLAKIGDKGLFTKELEEGLLRDEIDFAVHSLKDLPTVLPTGLEIAAFCEREEPRDVFLSKDGTSLEDLPPGALIGTSSLRRKAQLQHYRPDLTFTDLRGNLQTRWQKLIDSKMAGIVLAAAGVIRLGWEGRITQIIPEQIMLSAVGQGSVAIEIASERTDLRKLITVLNHLETEKAVRAERALMKKLEGGCQVPIGALGKVQGDEVFLEGLVASLNGEKVLRGRARGFEPEDVGLEVANQLLAQGAAGILAEIR
ncbi:MAG: hydroxymethylbilane synthase [Desulfitobacteriaceae bacterium]